MSKFPKETIHNVPENYFVSLPDKILSKRKQRIKQFYLSGIAAAAICVIGFFFLMVRSTEIEWVNYQAEINEDVEYYISTGVWNEEDVLLLAENPNDLLDAITEEEWNYQLGEEGEELLLNEILY